MSSNDKILAWLENKKAKYEEVYSHITNAGMKECGKIRIETLDDLIEIRKQEIR